MTFCARLKDGKFVLFQGIIAVLRRFSIKKLFQKITKNSQENTLNRKGHHISCFPVNVAIFDLSFSQIFSKLAPLMVTIKISDFCPRFNPQPILKTFSKPPVDEEIGLATILDKIWNKIKKSSKTGQEEKTLISAHA